MRFVKRPVEIEAEQFDGHNVEKMRDFTDGLFNLTAIRTGLAAEVYDKLHDTWVGVKPSDWIIKGVQGEFYPCDAAVFLQTYETPGESPQAKAEAHAHAMEEQRNAYGEALTRIINGDQPDRAAMDVMIALQARQQQPGKGAVRADVFTRLAQVEYPPAIAEAIKHMLNSAPPCPLHKVRCVPDEKALMNEGPRAFGSSSYSMRIYWRCPHPEHADV